SVWGGWCVRETVTPPAAPGNNPGPPARQSAVRREDVVYISICSGVPIIKISAVDRPKFVLGQLHYPRRNRRCSFGRTDTLAGKLNASVVVGWPQARHRAGSSNSRLMGSSCRTFRDEPWLSRCFRRIRRDRRDVKPPSPQKVHRPGGWHQDHSCSRTARRGGSRRAGLASLNIYRLSEGHPAWGEPRRMRRSEHDPGGGV